MVKLRAGLVVCLAAISLLAASRTDTIPQSADSLQGDLEFLGLKKTPSGDRKMEIQESGNEVRILLQGMIRVYQIFLSSQDGDNCGFTPTCSRFGQTALKKYGLVEGVLMTSDRLQRCNGFGRDYYPTDPATDKAIDPVSADALWH